MGLLQSRKCGPPLAYAVMSALAAFQDLKIEALLNPHTYVFVLAELPLEFIIGVILAVCGLTSQVQILDQQTRGSGGFMILTLFRVRPTLIVTINPRDSDLRDINVLRTWLNMMAIAQKLHES